MKRLEQRFPTIHLGMPDFIRVTATTIPLPRPEPSRHEANSSEQEDSFK